MKVINYHSYLKAGAKSFQNSKQQAISENFVDKNLRLIEGSDDVHDYIFDLTLLEGTTILHPSIGDDHALIIRADRHCPYSVKIVNLPEDNQAIICKVDLENQTMAYIFFSTDAFSHVILQTPSGKILEDYVKSGNSYVENKQHDKYHPYDKHAYCYDSFEHYSFAKHKPANLNQPAQYLWDSSSFDQGNILGLSSHDKNYNLHYEDFDTSVEFKEDIDAGYIFSQIERID